MMFKPFKPPALKALSNLPCVDLTGSDDERQSPPVKKRRLLVHAAEDSPPKKQAPVISLAADAPKKALVFVKDSNAKQNQSSSSLATTIEFEGYFMVLW